MEARMHASLPEMRQKKITGRTDNGKFRNTIEAGVAGEGFYGIAGAARVRADENARAREEVPGKTTGIGEA
ncbi:MAG: hypothetical protein OEM47_04655 [Deltaproteobacteria bacterium]|nr:hypothetical protein [Deltaproteobacteria bacterium]